jgi:glycosyltransferase involved in cell wall biosynthesis
MHIGYDVSQTGSGKAGCGFFAHAMIRAMLEIAPRHRYSLFPSFGDFYFDPLMPVANPYRGAHVRYGPRHLSRESAAAFWSSASLEKSVGRPDVIHANNFWCPVQLAESRLVYTCYDLGFMADPRWTTEANRVGCFEGMFRSAIAADWVVAISASSRASYLRAFPHFPEERIRVIHPCSRFADASSEGHRPKSMGDIRAGGFWLSVGTIEPRKNQARLAQAYARYLALGGAAMPLVLAGGAGWLMEGFERQLEELGIGARVVMTGYVSDDELAWLYRNCYANLYPSLYEGFGLPILEGMQFGAATVSSDSTSMPEVAGDAAILVPPEDVEGWARAMLRLGADRGERDRLAAAARSRAARFDRKASAAALLSLYEEALAAPRRGEARDILTR